MYRGILTLLAAACLPAHLLAATSHPQAEQQALDLAKQAITLRSVRGAGNQASKVAEVFKSALVAGGITDVTITPVDDTAYLVARWPGSDAKLKPLVISGHMDVVEAKPSDWQRDPFTPVVENGMLFGRGASDTKTNDALAVVSLIELKREGYKPKRTIILEFSGDEETTMKTSEMIAKELPKPEMVLNTDGIGGHLDADGKPQYFTWEGAEKTANDFELTVTSAGGHSSAPREGENAIARLAAVLVKIDKYHFKPELNDITKAFFTEAANFEDAKTAEAMRDFVKDPNNEQALAVLRKRPTLVGRTATTCVPTLISGGHAVNALPQRATANVNCRIFPGHTPAQIMAELKQVGDDSEVEFKDVTVGSVATDASPIRPDLVAAVTKAIHIGYPGVTVIPTMSAGASDSEWFRHDGVPAYNISPLFIKSTDQFSHGLNERIPVANIGPSIDYFLSLIPDLTRK